MTVAETGTSVQAEARRADPPRGGAGLAHRARRVLQALGEKVHGRSSAHAAGLRIVADVLDGRCVMSAISSLSRRRREELADEADAIHDLVFDALIEQARHHPMAIDEALVVGRTVARAHAALASSATREEARPRESHARERWVHEVRHELGNRMYALQLALHALRQARIARCTRMSADTLRRLERGLGALPDVGLDAVRAMEASV